MAGRLCLTLAGWISASRMGEANQTAEEQMAVIRVQFAVFGALPGGDSTKAEAFDVTSQLQTFIDEGGGVTEITIGFGDPSPGNLKHFGAKVIRDGQEVFFACEENQFIDFNHGGGPPISGSAPANDFLVKFAGYGALPGGNLSEAQAFDVTSHLQALLNIGPVITANNTFFSDPSPGNQKHFAAVVARGGQDFHFACAEGQNIDFRSGGIPG
jgi:hypothetical protein